MRIWIFLITIFVLRFAFGETVAPRPEIAIRTGDALIVTAGLPILLSDLGSAGFVTPEIAKKASQVVILNALKDGEERTFTNSELVRTLKEKINLQSDLATLNWTYFVPEQTHVVAKKNKISEVRVMNLIQNQLAQGCPDCTFKFKEIKIPVVDSQSEFTSYDLDLENLKVAGSFLVPLHAQFDGADKTFYVTGQLATKTKALTPKRSFNVGDHIDADALRTEEVTVSYMADAFATTQDLNGKTAARPLGPGRPLLVSDLKKETVVLRGQSVRALVGDDVFEVTGQMSAEESGSIGDLVRVKNPETQKVLSGRVVDRGVVRIQ